LEQKPPKTHIEYRRRGFEHGLAYRL